MIVHYTGSMIQNGMTSFKPRISAAFNPNRQTVDLWPDFAAIVGVGRNSVYAGARRGDFRTIRIGKKIVVPMAEVERLLSGGCPKESNQ
jgi:hypothetical protein